MGPSERLCHIRACARPRAPVGAVPSPRQMVRPSISASDPLPASASAPSDRAASGDRDLVCARHSCCANDGLLTGAAPLLALEAEDPRLPWFGFSLAELASCLPVFQNPRWHQMDPLTAASSCLTRRCQRVCWQLLLTQSESGCRVQAQMA